MIGEKDSEQSSGGKGAERIITDREKRFRVTAELTGPCRLDSLTMCHRSFQLPNPLPFPPR